MRNLNRILKPDKYKLDEEWELHSDEVDYYLKQMAEARKKMDAYKEFVSETKAKVNLELRKRKPKDFGLDKFTETLLDHLTILQDDYKEVMEKYLEAKYEYHQASNIVSALEHKRDAIKGLEKLFGFGYYSLTERKRQDVTKKKATKNIKKTSKTLKKEK